jgi:hypothetical protein
LPQVFGPKFLAPLSLLEIGKAYTHSVRICALQNKQKTYIFLACDTNVTVYISFGGTNWAISPLDMNLGTLNDTMIGNAGASSPSQMCAGGIFDIGIGSAPAWIVGDTFLKNVYSVFHASPAAVGFAQLAGG